MLDIEKEAIETLLADVIKYYGKLLLDGNVITPESAKVAFDGIAVMVKALKDIL